MSVINIFNHSPISDLIRKKERNVKTYSEYSKIERINVIYIELISKITEMSNAENAYYDAKDKLVRELPKVMRTENYDYGAILTENVDDSIETIKSIYNDSQKYIDELLQLTEISDFKFEKQYVFDYSENKAENTLFTALKLIEQYLN